MGNRTQTTDRLSELWEAQRLQQRELGLEPAELSDLERRAAVGDLICLLHEEAAELGRLSPHYKRHLLRSASVSAVAVAEECVDVLKTVLSIAQLQGVTLEQLCDAFHTKTHVVSERAAAERLAIAHDAKLLCVDLDDVIFDLGPFRELWGVHDDLHAPDRLVASERMKAEFYEGGRFRELEPIPGAPEALRRISAAGYTIVAITARPQWQYKRLYGDTVYSLRKHNIPFDVVLFNKDKVEALYEHVCPAWPVAFVEDMERNAKALAAAGIRVFLYDQPHNQGVSSSASVLRVKDWQQVIRLLGIEETTK